MKKVATILANGFEEIEALTIVDVLRRAGIDCDLASKHAVHPNHGIYNSLICHQTYNTPKRY